MPHELRHFSSAMLLFAHEVEQMTDSISWAENLRAETQQEVDEQLQKTRDEAEQMLEAAREQAAAIEQQAQQSIQNALAEAQFEAERRVEDYTRNLETELGQVLANALRDIFDSTPPDDYLKKIVRSAIRERAGPLAARLKVSPQDASQFGLAFEDSLPRGTTVEIEQVPYFEEGEAVLTSATGETAFSVEGMQNDLIASLQRFDQSNGEPAL